MKNKPCVSQITYLSLPSASANNLSARPIIALVKSVGQKDLDDRGEANP